MKKLLLHLLIIGVISFGVKAVEIVPIQAEQIQFWNHAATYPIEYEGLLKSAEMYDPIINFTENNSHVQITLIKKFSDWHQQHSNGLKIYFNNPTLTFSDLEGLIFNVSLNKEASFIPSKADLYQRYHQNIVSGLIQKSWLNELFSEYGVVNVKLFGEHHDDQKIETVFANYQLELNSAMVNHFQKTEIPLSMFNFYRQKNWQEHTVSLNEIKKRKVFGVLITAETVNEKTLRSYLQDSFSKSVQESYLELAISFNNLSLIIKN